MRQVLSPLAFVAVASLPSASTNSGAIVQGPNGILFFSDGTNWWPLNGRYPASAIVASSGAISTSETYVSAPFPIPASTLAAGMAFRIVAHGTCTASSAKTSTFNVRLGTAGTTADTVVLAATSASSGSGTGVPFRFEAIVTIRTIGSVGTAVASVEIVNNGVTGVAAVGTTVAGAGVTAAVNTTVKNFLGLSYVSGSGSGVACTFNQVTVEQVK